MNAAVLHTLGQAPRCEPFPDPTTPGTAPEVWLEAIRQLLDRVAEGRLHIETERVSLADIEAEWDREQQGRRLVVVP